MYKKIQLLIAFGITLFELSGIAFGAVPRVIATQLLTAGKIDLSGDTITLPLHHGRLTDGRSVWYVLLDSSNQDIARAQGLVYAPALGNALKLGAVRTATRDSYGELVFDKGVVDFSSNRSLVTGDAPDLFPPKSATPGSVGNEDYSPYVQVRGEGDGVYNAPILAFNVAAAAISFCGPKAKVDYSLVHDKVVRICPEQNQVTLALSHGFANGKPLIYVSLDSSNPVAATMESATYAPALAALNNSSATLPLFAVANGATGKENPNRQGFDSALMGDGSPLNVLTGIPTLSSTPYSPLWELYIAQWTPQVISQDERVILTGAQQIQAAFQAGALTGIGGGPLISSGILVNCPAIAILK